MSAIASTSNRSNRDDVNRLKASIVCQLSGIAPFIPISLKPILNQMPMRYLASPTSGISNRLELCLVSRSIRDSCLASFCFVSTVECNQPKWLAYKLNDSFNSSKNYFRPLPLKPLDVKSSRTF